MKEIQNYSVSQKKQQYFFLTLDPFWYFGHVPKLSKRVHPYSTPEPVSSSLDRENILSKIPKGTCVLCLLLSLNSHQFTAWRCFVRVRIIEILLRRPQPTRNTQATLATKSQLPDPPLLHLQHAKFAFRHNSFLSTFFTQKITFTPVWSWTTQLLWWQNSTLWPLCLNPVFFYLHYFELWQEIFWKSWRKYLPV